MTSSKQLVRGYLATMTWCSARSVDTSEHTDARSDGVERASDQQMGIAAAATTRQQQSVVVGRVVTWSVTTVTTQLTQNYYRHTHTRTQRASSTGRCHHSLSHTHVRYVPPHQARAGLSPLSHKHHRVTLMSTDCISSSSSSSGALTVCQSHSRSVPITAWHGHRRRRRTLIWFDCNIIHRVAPHYTSHIGLIDPRDAFQ